MSGKFAASGIVKAPMKSGLATVSGREFAHRLEALRRSENGENADRNRCLLPRGW